MADGVTIGGEQYELLHPITKHPIPIFSCFDDSGIDVPEFRPSDGHNKLREEEPDLMVWHWTGSLSGSCGQVSSDRPTRALIPNTSSAPASAAKAFSSSHRAVVRQPPSKPRRISVLIFGSTSSAPHVAPDPVTL